MRFKFSEVKPAQQPAPLFMANGYRLNIIFYRPFEFILFQAFLPKRKAGGIPIQDFELGAMFIAKDKQCLVVYVQFHRFTHDHRQPIDGFAKVYRVAVQVDGN